jgi:hypothetical protein
MKQILANISWRNWNKKPGNVLTTIFGMLSILLSVQDEFLNILHSAPFPVPTTVDDWFKWLLKASVWLVGVLMVLSRKKNDIDIGVKVSHPNPAENEQQRG